MLDKRSLNSANTPSVRAGKFIIEPSEASVNDHRRAQILSDLHRLERLKQHLSENGITVYSLKWKGITREIDGKVKPLFFLNSGRGHSGNYTLEQLEQFANVRITTSQ